MQSDEYNMFLSSNWEWEEYADLQIWRSIPKIWVCTEHS